MDPEQITVSLWQHLKKYIDGQCHLWAFAIKRGKMMEEILHIEVWEIILAYT